MTTPQPDRWADGACVHPLWRDADGLPLSSGEVCARCGWGPGATPPAPAADLFEPVGHGSAKLRCTVCGATGFPGGMWQRPHVAGHKPCRAGCGKMLSVLQDGSARMHPGPHGCGRGTGQDRPLPHAVVARLSVWSGLTAEETERRVRAALGALGQPDRLEG